MFDDTGKIQIEIWDKIFIENLLEISYEELMKYSMNNQLYLLYKELPLK
jgi:hypothetical protein